MKKLYVQNRDEWREWLSNNYNIEKELWLLFYKKETGQPSLDYEAAVEEALCFGWIDSIIKKIDPISYVRKFTPRKDDSNWSKLNKIRAEKMIKQGRMTSIGLARIKAAKNSGMWDKEQVKPVISYDIPAELEQALDEDRKAKWNFDKLSPSHRKQYILWISMAKRPETRNKRVRETMNLLAQGEKLDLK